MLEYPHGIPCYMKENNIKIDRKKRPKVPHQLLDSHVRKNSSLLHFGCRLVNEFVADAECKNKVGE